MEHVRGFSGRLAGMKGKCMDEGGGGADEKRE